MKTALGQTWAEDFDKWQMQDIIQRAIVRADALFELAREEPEFQVKLDLIRDAGDLRQMAQTIAAVIGVPSPQSLTEAWAHSPPHNPLILTDAIRAVS